MKLLRILLPILVFGICALVPHAASAAGNATFFGPIIPPACHCDTAQLGYASAPDWGCVLQVIQNAMNFAISLGFIIFVLVLAYAGVLFIANPANPSARETGKTVIVNALVGLLVALCSWLLVDFVMKTLYHPEASGTGVAQLGPWNAILGGNEGDYCIKPHNPPTTAGGVSTGQGTGGTGTVTSTGSGPNCPAADPSIMVAFPSSVTKGDSERATQETVSNFLAMRTAALQDGIDLKVTDGFRSEQEQVALWNQYCSSGTCGATKVAKPCSLGGNGSNHNSGQAVDIDVGCSDGQSGCNTPAYNWLKAHGAQWNFRNAIPTDPLHWSPSGS